MEQVSVLFHVDYGQTDLRGPISAVCDHFGKAYRCARGVGVGDVVAIYYQADLDPITGVTRRWTGGGEPVMTSYYKLKRIAALSEVIALVRLSKAPDRPLMVGTWYEVAPD